MVNLKRANAEKTLKVSADHLCVMEVSIWWWSQKGEGALFCSCWSICFLHVSGDSFVVNAFLRRGMEECERYGAAEHKLKSTVGIGRVLSVLFYLSSGQLLPAAQLNELICFPVCLKWNEKEHEFSALPIMTDKTVATSSQHSKEWNTELGLDRC